MRQAGRYLPEYRELRRRVGSFKRLYREHAAEISLMPLKRYELDAAIIFSDILIALDAVGLEVRFDERGPSLSKPLHSAADLNRLRNSVTEEAYDYLAEAMQEVRAKLPNNIPLIGFIGAPWTLAVYGVAGLTGKDASLMRKMLYQEPGLVHAFLNLLTKEVSQLALLQIDNGADIIQIFDSWAGLLPRRLYRAFSLNYITQVIKALRAQRPTILFARECPLMLAELLASGATALSLDWKIDIHQAFAEVGHQTVLQGNLDPALLYAKRPVWEEETRRIIEARPPECGHIFNLGHGITPDIAPETITQLVELVHQLGKR